MKTMLLGMVGTDLSWARTPAMHEAEGLAHGVPTVCRRLDALLVNKPLPEIVDAVRALGFDGLIITHPFKTEVVGLLDAISPSAAAVGAANTVVVSSDGVLTGHNTEVTGFTQALRAGLAGARMNTVVQIGAGGAGSATAHALLNQGVSRIILHDLNEERVTSLAKSINAVAGREVVVPGTPADIPAADGVVDATPMGMPVHPGTAFDPAVLRPGQWVADVVYLPYETELVLRSREIGCRILDGGHMALYQSVDAFRLFTGLEADVERMRETFHSFD